MNKITILGSGDTLGTPVAGCNNPSCIDEDPKSKRFRFGLLLEIEGKKILIDTNPDLKWQCLQSGFELKDIDYLLISHTHSDHVNGMGEFFYRRPLPIPTYFPDHPLALKHMDYFRYLEREEVLSFIPYSNYEPFNLTDTIRVTPVDLNHGFPCSGFIIETGNTKIGVISDTNLKMSDKTMMALNNCDYLFADAFSEDIEQVKKVYIECGLEAPDLNSEWFHMTIPEAKQVQELTKSKKLYTMHMSRHMSPHKELVEKYQTDKFIIGFDNLVVSF
ncbi:MAG: MBL fold metallo-hydrolase [bacterium]|nr:MBL fold metallo-hydrolase [bacterium]